MEFISAAGSELLFLAIDRVNRYCIQDTRYSIKFFIWLSAHSVLCTFLSALMVIVGAAWNPCDDYLLHFQVPDIVSILLSTCTIICSWKVFSILYDGQSTRQNGGMIYLLFLLTLTVATFLTFCGFMFIVTGTHLLDLWCLVLDPHTRQNYKNLRPHQTLTCFKKFRSEQLAVLYFSYIFAGGISIFRFMCHESLWQLVEPIAESALLLTKRTPEEFQHHYGYFSSRAIPLSMMSADNNEITVTAEVHHDLEDTPQQSEDNLPQTNSAAHTEAAGGQTDRETQKGPAEATSSSGAQPSDLAVVGLDEHSIWIKELNWELVMSDDDNCEVPNRADAIRPPQAPGHLAEPTIQLQNGFEEEVLKVLDVDYSKLPDHPSHRLKERRGAISAPSGSSTLDLALFNPEASCSQNLKFAKPSTGSSMSAIPASKMRLSPRKRWNPRKSPSANPSIFSGYEASHLKTPSSHTVESSSDSEGSIQASRTSSNAPSEQSKCLRTEYGVSWSRTPSSLAAVSRSDSEGSIQASRISSNPPSEQSECCSVQYGASQSKTPSSLTTVSSSDSEGSNHASGTSDPASEQSECQEVEHESLGTLSTSISGLNSDSNGSNPASRASSDRPNGYCECHGAEFESLDSKTPSTRTTGLSSHSEGSNPASVISSDPPSGRSKCQEVEHEASHSTSPSTCMTEFSSSSEEASHASKPEDPSSEQSQVKDAEKPHISVPLGFSQIGPDFPRSSTGALGSDSDGESKNVGDWSSASTTWTSQYTDYEELKTGALSSKSDEECRRQNELYRQKYRDPVDNSYSSLGSRPYYASTTSSSSEATSQFGNASEVPASGVSKGAEGSSSQMDVPAAELNASTVPERDAILVGFSCSGVQREFDTASNQSSAQRLPIDPANEDQEIRPSEDPEVALRGSGASGNGNQMRSAGAVSLEATAHVPSPIEDSGLNVTKKLKLSQSDSHYPLAAASNFAVHATDLGAAEGYQSEGDSAGEASGGVEEQQPRRESRTFAMDLDESPQLDEENGGNNRGRVRRRHSRDSAGEASGGVEEQQPRRESRTFAMDLDESPQLDEENGGNNRGRVRRRHSRDSAGEASGGVEEQQPRRESRTFAMDLDESPQLDEENGGNNRGRVRRGHSRDSAGEASGGIEVQQPRRESRTFAMDLDESPQLDEENGENNRGRVRRRHSSGTTDSQVLDNLFSDE